jgi:hypothetical protein
MCTSAKLSIGSYHQTVISDAKSLKNKAIHHLMPRALCYQIWKTNESWRIVEKSSKSGWKRLPGDYRTLGVSAVA